MKNKISSYSKVGVKNNIHILELSQKSNTIFLKACLDFVSFDCNSRKMTSWDFSWCCQVKQCQDRGREVGSTCESSDFARNCVY